MTMIPAKTEISYLNWPFLNNAVFQNFAIDSGFAETAFASVLLASS